MQPSCKQGIHIFVERVFDETTPVVGRKLDKEPGGGALFWISMDCRFRGMQPKDTPHSARQLARLVAELLPYAKGKVAANASSLGDPCKKAGKALHPMDQAVPPIVSSLMPWRHVTSLVHSTPQLPARPCFLTE